MDDELNFDSLNAGPEAINLSSLEGVDLSNLFNLNSGLGTDLQELDLSNIFSNKDGQGVEFSGFDNLDISAMLGGGSAEDLAKIDWASLYNDGLAPGEVAKREGSMESLSDKKQDFGGADVTKYLDEFNQNFNPAGGFGSQYQTVGTNRVMVNDDGTATILNPTTGETSYLDEAQTTALVNNGTLNSKNSGYVAATGGTKDIPGGGKTVVNKDGTKTVTTSDGKTFVINKDGTVTKGQDTITTKVIDNLKKVIGGGTSTKTGDKKDSNSGMLMALLALMAMMNKGGGGGSSPSAVIPSLSADRKQLPYGAASGSKARPGAGGVNYFSPTTYTQRAAGGGMMYGGGGISDLGGYSDGGRLLRGPGDGVSDSIPATIGGKQPARLAEGEFVVPARIVSELGNGSTEAGAKKLYAMMDRVQKARRKTKNVAADTKAHKYLPA